MRASKYQPWTDYLRNCSEAFCRMTFAEIEQLIGNCLPDTANKHASVFWNNANGHYAKHWLRAGWIVVQYDSLHGYVVFKKDVSGAEHYLTKSEHDSQNPRKNIDAFPERQDPRISSDALIFATQKYMDEIMYDAHARYLSWEHCYGFFAKNHVNPNEEQLDLMCLHLAWYLASWGMLRGSSFLLQKDYRIHLPVVKLLVSEEFRELYDCPIEKYTESEILDKIISLSSKIIELYKGLTIDVGDGEGRNASDTLVTKILLGTVGCTPAYDRFFKSGLSVSNIAQQRYGKKSMQQLVMYYIDHYDQFEACRQKISENRITYTPMKILDMCFWQIGYDKDATRK